MTTIFNLSGWKCCLGNRQQYNKSCCLCRSLTFLL